MWRLDDMGLQKGSAAPSSVSVEQCDELLTGNLTSPIQRYLSLICCQRMIWTCIFSVLPCYDKSDIFPELTLCDGLESFLFLLNIHSPLFCSFTYSGWVPV